MLLMPTEDSLRLTRLETTMDAHLIQSAERAAAHTKAIEKQTEMLREFVEKADAKYVNRELYEQTTLKTVASLVTTRLWAASAIIGAVLTGLTLLSLGEFK